MAYSEEQVREFQEEFAKRRRAQIVFTIVAVFVALILALFGQGWSQVLAGNEALLLGALFVFIMVTIFFGVRLGRCPACGGLMSNSWRLHYCPLCGVKLR